MDRRWWSGKCSIILGNSMAHQYKAPNVIDCPELRDLLIFVSADLTEADIPHRSMVTKLIIENFQKEYEKLCKEIQVNWWSYSIFIYWWAFQELDGPRFIYKWCVVEKWPVCIHGRNRTLYVRWYQRSIVSTEPSCRLPPSAGEPYWWTPRRCIFSGTSRALCTRSCKLFFYLCGIPTIHIIYCRLAWLLSIMHRTIIQWWKD